MPTTTQTKPSRRDTLNIRIKPEERGLIDRAAELAGKTRTDFEAALDAPPRTNEALRPTMQPTLSWDTPSPTRRDGAECLEVSFGAHTVGRYS